MIDRLRLDLEMFNIDKLYVVEIDTRQELSFYFKPDIYNFDHCCQKNKCWANGSNQWNYLEYSLRFVTYCIWFVQKT